MGYPATAEVALYRRCRLIIGHADIMVIAPDGDIACFPSMSRVRIWVRRKRKELGL